MGLNIAAYNFGLRYAFRLKYDTFYRLMRF